MNTPIPGKNSRRIGWRDKFLSCCLKAGLPGFHRLWRFLSGNSSQRGILFRTTYGNLFSLNPLGYIERFVFQKGYYEPEVIEAVLAHLDDTGVFWDIGANIGLHSITAQSIRTGARVCSFEPNPETFELLAENCRLNSINLNLNSFALSDRDGTATFYLAAAGNLGMSTLQPWAQANYPRTCTVQTHRGDDIIARGALPSPTVIKLDVEGHEESVLRGLAQTLRKDTCRAVIFEAPKSESAPGESFVFSFLMESGFTPKLLPSSEEKDSALGNFLALKIKAKP